MKTATTIVYEVLNTAEELKELNFFTNSIPESDRALPSLPIGRIVELMGKYDRYASDQPNAINFDVQVDVWLKSQREVEKYYYLLDSIMRQNSWTNTYTSIEDDPDLENAKRIIKRYRGTIKLDF